jgi:two-component system response regulator MtrA
MSAGTQAVHPPSSQARIDASVSTPKTILVAEDDAAIRRMLGRTLERAGYEVLTVEDGEDAIAGVKTYQPDLVLLDVMMPRADGLTVAKELSKHAETRGIPVIFVTAMSARASVVAGIEAGANSYITKPFKASRLLETVETVIGWED